jgi:hypothetical protein
MFEDALYSRELLKARRPGAKQEAYFRALAARCAAASMVHPGTWWAHHLFFPSDAAGCCRDGAILRFSPAPPPGLEAHLPLHLYQAVIRDVNGALRPRDGCINQGCAIAVFVLLFYTTFIGIFFYMCAEASCNARALRRAREGVARVLELHNQALAAHGLRVSARYNPSLPEALDTGLGEGGAREHSAPYLCFSLLLQHQRGGGGGAPAPLPHFLQQGGGGAAAAAAVAPAPSGQGAFYPQPRAVAPEAFGAPLAPALRGEPKSVPLVWV